MSGTTSARAHAKVGPVRPKPVSTSSAISSTPAARVRSRIARSTLASHTRIPPAPSSSGSTMTAASSRPRAASRRSSSAIVADPPASALGSGSRATSNRCPANGSVNTPRSLTAMAPNVSP